MRINCSRPSCGSTLATQNQLSLPKHEYPQSDRYGVEDEDLLVCASKSLQSFLSQFAVPSLIKYNKVCLVLDGHKTDASKLHAGPGSCLATRLALLPLLNSLNRNCVWGENQKLLYQVWGCGKLWERATLAARHLLEDQNPNAGRVSSIGVKKHAMSCAAHS